jgi:RNA polymerase sigma factor (sigma-70 family)
MTGRLQNVAVKQAFERVVSDHGTTVLRVCRAVLGPVDADDAWSETFLSAMKAYPDLPAHANVEAWLVTIAHRKAIDVTRARTRHAIPTDHVPDTPTAPHAEPDDDLADALALLPDKQKQAVAYHYLGGLPYSDVAAILGGSTDAARRCAADGIATLRRTYPGVTARSGTSRKEETR